MKKQMNVNCYKGLILFLIIGFSLYSCGSNKGSQWEGQGPINIVRTEKVPIQLQHKGVFDIGGGIYVSNDFDGARLNGVNLTSDNLVTILVTPENTPINGSPWYSYKIWADTEKDIDVKMTYLEGYNHRYYPKISKDGKNWEVLDSTKVKIDIRTDGEREIPISATLDLTLGSDTTWISAQELITDTHVDAWIEDLTANSFVKKVKIGESSLGQDINGLEIGHGNDEAMIVVLSRQHPPEVTGYLAMESFVEAISSSSSLAEEFRGEFKTYVVPVANPDGVRNGHWRHGYGGVDLNRDWGDFNQPETAAIRDFFKKKVEDSGGKIYFFVDFHSTWQDIYYTIDPEQKGNMPGLIPKLITAVGEELPDYQPNIRPSPATGKNITSTSYFFTVHGAESLTYELGDNTPRPFIRQKGEVTANKLMELMTE